MGSGRISIDKLKVEKIVRELLVELKLDVTDSNYLKTPKRVTEYYQYLREREMPKISVFPTTANEMVVLKEYTSWSLCPHHLLPVRYTFRIGYVPNGYVLGLSKLARIADYVLRDLPLQEEIPIKIIDILEKVLKPMGSGCQVEGHHGCMEIRGIRSEGTFVSTKLKGVMLLNPSAHNEFLTS